MQSMELLTIGMKFRNDIKGTNDCGSEENFILLSKIPMSTENFPIFQIFINSLI